MLHSETNVDDPNLLFEIDRVYYNTEWKMPRIHHHNIYEILILEEGKDIYMISDEIFDIDVYDIILIEPNLWHISYGNDYTRTCIYFSNIFLNQYFTVKAKNILLECFNKKIISLKKDDFFKMKKVISELEKEEISNPQNHIFVYIFEILMILNNNEYENKSKRLLSQSYKKITPILAYIHKNYKKISCIEEIAENVYMTKYHLCRSFKKYIGMTITQYLNNLKIKHACDMLVNTNNSVTEIGFMCGFNSTMYFCKIFKEITNMTPNKYRNKAK